MPTEQDLRHALSALADRAPERCEMPAPTTHTHHRRASRILLPGLAAAAVVAVTVTISLVTSRTDPTPAVPGSSTTASPYAPNFVAPTVLPIDQYIFDIAPIKGYTSSDGGVGRAQQYMELTELAPGRPTPTKDGSVPLGSARATVAVYPRDGFRPPKPANAVAVTVNGVTGFYGTLEAQPEDNGITFDGALAWPYAPGAWAVVFSSSAAHRSLGRRPGDALTRTEATRFADAVRPGQTHEVRTPVRLATVPGNLTSKLQSFGSAGRATSILIGPDSDPTMIKTLRLQIYADAKVPDAGDTGFGYTPVRFGAWHGTFYPDEDRLDVSNGTVGITIGLGQPNGPFTLAQLERTVEEMTFASRLADQSTWFPLTELLP